MPVTLAIEGDGTIPVKDLKDGQLAVITNWVGAKHPLTGRIVQRYRDVIISIGMGWDEGWENLISSSSPHLDCRVRVLRAGEKIIITAN